MRTTIVLKDALIQAAQEVTGIKEKTALLHMGLELLIQKETAKRLIKLGGMDPRARLSPKRKVKAVR